VRADKKPSLKADKKSARGGFKQSAVGYGKKTILLEEAITQMNLGRYGRSSAALKELLALDPHNMEARRLFATLHLRVGSLILARQAFDSLIDDAFGQQDYWLAESLLREYLTAGPRCVPYLEKLGSILQDKGEMLEAVTEYGKAVDILIEDPDPEHPDRALQLYEKIKELAPGSPVDVRLAGCVDPQTGQLIARPLAEAAPYVPSMDEDGAAPMASESIAESIPWEQTENSPLNQEFAGSPYHPQGVPADVSAGLQQEEQEFGDAPLPYDPPMNGHGAIGLDSELAPMQSGEFASLATEQVQVLDSQPPDTQEETVPPSVPAPMPWEEVQEATIDIPDQTVAESPEALASPLALDQSPAGPAAVPNGGEFSWDSVFQNTLNVGSAPPVLTTQPSYGQEVDPGTIEIQEAARTTLPLSVAAAPSEVASMPWDQVQESTIVIPQQQMEETVVESPVEPAQAVHPEPAYTQDPPLSILSTVDDASGTDAFSIMSVTLFWTLVSRFRWSQVYSHRWLSLMRVRVRMLPLSS
jgi:tetratricopeptide (TPR) repeat protein